MLISKALDRTTLLNNLQRLTLPLNNDNSPLIFKCEKIAPPKSIYTFEILRFAAALVTFFGHYIHFFVWQKTEVSWFNDINPEIGELAVPIFFMLSGAIFAHTYGNSIVVNKTTFFSFVKKRFARLYPLHILALILVVVLQAIVWRRHGEYFMYQFNDLKHFLLQLFFISNWTLFEAGPNFNGPVWSVSHEVFLYLCFFLFFYCSSKVKSKNLFILGCYAAIYFSNPGTFIYDATGNFRNTYMLKSLFAFMTGVFIYQAYRIILRYDWREQALLSALFVIGLKMASFQLLSYGIPHGHWAPIAIFLLLLINTYFRLENHPKLHRQCFELGNLTYSSYLLHFPIQLIMVIFSDYVLKIDFTNKSVFASYLFIVMATSYFVYNYFELPIKNFILGCTVFKVKI